MSNSNFTDFSRFAGEWSFIELFLDLDLDLDLDIERDDAEYFYGLYLPFLRNLRNAGLRAYLLALFKFYSYFYFAGITRIWGLLNPKFYENFKLLTNLGERDV